MIRFNNISKSFNNKKILDDISGEFYSGKINMIIGASGTGKSVLLKSIVGIHNIDKGNIYFDDIRCDHLNRNDSTVLQVKKNIGMLFQNSALILSKTIEENVRLPLDLLTNLSLSEKQEKVAYVLDQVNLIDAKKKYPNEISGGMQKRAGIARAIVNNPKYLFCDEPNSGLDPQTSFVIDQLIQKITGLYNTTTVVVSHNLDSVITISDNIIFLYKSKKIWEGNKESIMNTDNEYLLNFLKSSKSMSILLNEKNNINI